MKFVRTRRAIDSLNGRVFDRPESSLSLLVCGDISLDPEFGPDIGVYQRGTSRFPSSRWVQLLRNVYMRALRVLYPRKQAMMELADQELLLKNRENSHKGRPLFGLAGRFVRTRFTNFPSEESFQFPFKRIAPLLRSKDLVFANLETPLADRSARKVGLFRSDKRFTAEITSSGIGLVNLANNHIFDCGTLGFQQTLNTLENANLPFTGAGKDLESARKGHAIELRGKKMLFLGYTQYCNQRFFSVADEYPGILPLDTELVVDDIKNARERADLVFVSLHWGVEDQPYILEKCVEQAHAFIDSGADGIIGHHPHVPHGIEIYRQCPIIYSLGNFMFPLYSEKWRDNILVEFVIGDEGIYGLVIHPIAGRGDELSQPFVLEGERASHALKDVQAKSAALGTAVGIQDGLGYIKVGA